MLNAQRLLRTIHLLLGGSGGGGNGSGSGGLLLLLENLHGLLVVLLGEPLVAEELRVHL